MKRFFISSLIVGLLFTGCDLQNDEIAEDDKYVIDLYSQEGVTEGLQDKIDEDSQDEATEELQDEVSEPQGEITYPKFGQFGLNILADDFVEATQTSDKRVEYSVSAEVPAGASLKIVIKTKSDEKNVAWGSFMPSGIVNWQYAYYNAESKCNIFTVYESGKRADLGVIFESDCIIEFYENGATTPTKVKEIKVSQDVITEEQPEETEGFQGVITYPKTGKFGLNILADDFVKATKTENGRFEYSVSAEVPAGASLKIVIKTKSDEKNVAWGGFMPSSIDNWRYSYYDVKSKVNSFTVYESGKRADLGVIFESDCIIEFYENGVTSPTKVKEIKVSNDIITEESKEQDSELQGEIVYPKSGKYGLNILADNFVEAKKTEWRRNEYSVCADVPIGAGLKIVIKTRSVTIGVAWGGFMSDGLDNWRYTYYDTETKSNTFTVYESGKRADLGVIFESDCIIEFYENGSTTPTKVKQVTVID